MCSELGDVIRIRENRCDMQWKNYQRCAQTTLDETLLASRQTTAVNRAVNSVNMDSALVAHEREINNCLMSAGVQTGQQGLSGLAGLLGTTNTDLMSLLCELLSKCT